MLRHTEAFPAIDLSATGLEITDGSLAEPIGGGFNSQAWRLGSQVVKVAKGSSSPAGADSLRLTMQAEHYILEDSIGDYMPPTNYVVAEETGRKKRARVVTVQPFVEGVSLWDYLNIPSNTTDSLREFLEQCRQVYRKNRHMPDIANVETAFNVFRNSNILMGSQDDHPILVDTTFGKIQRSKALGPLWTRGIYAGSLVASARLKLDSARPVSQQPEKTHA